MLSEMPTLERPAETRRFALSTYLALLLGVMLLAVAVRVPQLTRYGYHLDEALLAEFASGRGLAQESFPLNQLVSPMDCFDLATAPPWWKVWSANLKNHPPLYALLLRFWQELFGAGDVPERAFSIVLSTLAVGVLFDTVALLNGRAVAFWAAILMAVSSPQVDYGRQTLSYAQLLLTALLSANALVRCAQAGWNARRGWALGAALLAMLLTHYFAVGTLLAMAVYAALRLRGQQRIAVLLTMAAAVAIFALVWGPFLWQQRHFLASADPVATFLKYVGAHPLLHTLTLTLQAPYALLAKPRDAVVGAASCMSVLYLLPLLLARRQPGLWFWSLWLDLTLLPLAVSDAWQHTQKLAFVRYTLVAGPAVYALLPAVLQTVTRRKWLGHAIPAAAWLACLLALPDVYHPPVTDPRLMVSESSARLGKDDLAIFVGTGAEKWHGTAAYLILSRYHRPFPCPVAFLDRPASGEVLARARHAHRVLIFTSGENGPDFLPYPTPPANGRLYQGVGLIWMIEEHAARP